MGLVVPIQNYAINAYPDMQNELETIQVAEQAGFSSVWLRDVPFDVPSFGDVGQIYDPFVYLGALAVSTSTISLGVASMILPLRHPAHIAKSAASVDRLSKGRLLLGIASCDRADEYPAMNIDYQQRGQAFRDAYDYLHASWNTQPIDNQFGRLHQSAQQPIALVPQPTASRVPLLITGASQQSPDWLAQHGDGWIIYPREPAIQAQVVRTIRNCAARHNQPLRPVIQPLYLNLLEDPNAPAKPMHLGVQCGVNSLNQYITDLQGAGVNHVALNLRFNQMPLSRTLNTLAQFTLPNFHNSRRNK